MSSNWDFYLCRVDDKPASIFVDVGIAAEAPLPQFGSMAYVRIYMLTPRPDGLSSQEEFAILKRIEDALEHLVTTDKVSIYVGCNTSDGCRDFFFYTSRPDKWNASVSSLMLSFPEYVFDNDVREDRQWSTYFSFLYPSEEYRECIKNRHTCEVLEKEGDRLEIEREIDHWAYFPRETDRMDFVARASELGFGVRGMIEPCSDEESYGVQLFRRDAPRFDNIDSVTLQLNRLAKECGGRYDGWETQVVG